MSSYLVQFFVVGRLLPLTLLMPNKTIDILKSSSSWAVE